MDLAGFWTLIDDARDAASDDTELADKIGAELAELPVADIVAFQRHFDTLHARSYGWRLWGAAYLMNGGCSDDGFDYFRAWLIAQGQDVYEKALKNPDSLASIDTPGAEFEEFMYVAQHAYEAKTGDAMPDAAANEVRPELGEGWDFDDENEMKQRYPKLFAKYTNQ